VSNPARALSVYERFLQVPEHLVAEIIRGVLVTQPRPAARHARAASRLGHALGPFDVDGPKQPGGWVILDEPELHLGSDILVPDLAGWRRERMPEMPDVAAFELAPDWVCEVISPSTAAVDRAEKLPLYAAAGVTNASLVDPLARTLEVLRLANGLWVLLAIHRDDARVRAEPFDAIEIELAALWAR
jgi:Uma2 family endonuclease